MRPRVHIFSCESRVVVRARSLKTIFHHWLGFWVLLVLTLAFCAGCAWGVRSLLTHKKKRYYDDGNRSPFRRGPVRSAKID